MEWVVDATAPEPTVLAPAANDRRRSGDSRRCRGFLLDTDRGGFPHATRSNTGLHNVISLILEIDIESAGATSVSRVTVLDRWHMDRGLARFVV